MTMRNAGSIIMFAALVGCSGSARVAASADARDQASEDLSGGARGRGAQETEAKPPTYPEGPVAMVGARPQWFEGPWASNIELARLPGVQVAMFMNNKPVVFVETNEKGKPKARVAAVKNGGNNAKASLLGMHETGWLIAGPGPYQVKTLCYTEGSDGGPQLFGGGARSRTSMRIVTVTATDCRPIAAAVAD